MIWSMSTQSKPVPGSSYLIGPPPVSPPVSADGHAEPRPLRTVRKRAVTNWKAMFDLEHAKKIRADRARRRWKWFAIGSQIGLCVWALFF